MYRARRCKRNSRSLNAVLMATLALALSTSALGVECAAFRDGINNLHRAGQRALVWRQAWANAEGRGERIHEGHPAVVNYQKYLDTYGRAFSRLTDHVTDILVDVNETNAEPLMSAVAELEAGRERVQELEESAPFPDPASFRLSLDNGARFMEALFATACD